MTVQRIDAKPSELPDIIRDTVSAGRGIRARLPGDGRLHVDRAVPFVCVYRRPATHADPGTRQLIEGEACHLIVDDAHEQETDLRQLCTSLCGDLVEQFGACLLLELWAAPAPVGNGPRAPAFRIVAPEHQAPDTMLETLQSALLQVRVMQQDASVQVNYEAQPCAPGHEPLIAPEVLRDMGIVPMGLEVSAIYRDTSTGQLFPLELRELHRGLAHALKRGLHAFTTTYTRHKPAHYHELGRHALTEAAWEVDKRLAQLSANVDLLLHVTPVNVQAAWHEFEHGGFQAAPEFHYRPRPLDPAASKRELYSIPVEQVEDPALEDLFTCKRDELDRQISMVGDRNTARFLHGGLQVYGSLDEGLLWSANALVDAVNERTEPGTAPAPAQAVLPPESFAARARELLAFYEERAGQPIAEVQVRPDVTGLLVSGGRLLIGADASVSVDRADAALAHEVETHLLTWFNGRQQRLGQLAAGMPGYEAVQEGLAVVAECLVGGLDDRRLRLLGARVLAVDSLLDGGGFVDTFRRLKVECGLPPHSAFTATMRVHRGGGFAKDLIYLKGLMQVLDYLRAGDDLGDLFIGKLSLDQLPIVDELRWRRVLTAPTLRPRFLDTPEGKLRIATLMKTRTVLDLLSD